MWEKTALTDWNVEKAGHCSVNSSRRKRHTIVMIYRPLVEFGYKVIGKNFDWPSASPLSWAFDTNGPNVGSWD